MNVTTPDLAIEVSGLHKSFGKVHALRGIDFSVPRGSVLGMLGPNGAGKTTAVRVLTTLLRPDSGRVIIEGYDVVRDAAAVRRRIGLAGQATAIQLELTGRENLEIMGRLNHMPRSSVKGRATELLERFEIADAADRPAKTYSGGMLRRLDLAASLVAEPSVLFLDEPTTGLDPYGRLGMWAIIRELVGRGTTLLLTTQYLEEADELANTIVVVDHGEVIASGTPDQLKDQVGGDLLEFPARRRGTSRGRAVQRGTDRRERHPAHQGASRERRIDSARRGGASAGRRRRDHGGSGPAPALARRRLSGGHRPRGRGLAGRSA
jgi:ABC-2 type transport system ATP-binding protein